MTQLRYSDICEGTFIRRKNRFIAEVMVDGRETVCHVKNTGRLKELLTKDATVYLEKSSNPKRKTGLSLISVEKDGRIVNIDSQVPNKVLYEALTGGKIKLPGFENITFLKQEYTYRSSRFDFYIESMNRMAYIEVKGVTLLDNGVAKFPDAPTIRGVKHIYELMNAKKEGFDAFVIFIVQMSDTRYFAPNDGTHKEFGDALRLAKRNGVEIHAYECDTGPDFIEFNGRQCDVLL